MSFSSTTAISDLPILGIANITFKSRDLAQARAFYQGVLGLPEAFALKNSSADVTSVYFKVNDEQFVEVMPGLAHGELVRQVRVAFQSSDVETLHAVYTARGLSTGQIERGPDGNPVFHLLDPEGNKLDFLQYVDESQQTRSRGWFLDPRRVSMHIPHVGLMIKRPATTMPFYYDKLGFPQGRLPGVRGEYIEAMSSDLNVETKNPPLDPNDPGVHDQYVREQYGAVQHVCLEVTDIRSARDTLQRRGGYDDLRVRAHVGNSRHWLVHVFDPDGSRSEIMERALQGTLPPMTVLAPGASEGVILPKTPGVLPWP